MEVITCFGCGKYPVMSFLNYVVEKPILIAHKQYIESFLGMCALTCIMPEGPASSLDLGQDGIMKNSTCSANWLVV